MATESRYSLWALPENAALVKFSKQIHTLSERFNSPLFLPHITMLRGILGREEELIQKLLGLREVNKFKVELGEMLVDQGRHTALAVQVNNSLEIDAVRMKSLAIFTGSQTPHFDHVSLLYTTSLLESERKSVAQGVGKNLPTSFYMTSLLLMNTASEKEVNWSELTRIKLS